MKKEHIEALQKLFGDEWHQGRLLEELPVMCHKIDERLLGREDVGGLTVKIGADNPVGSGDCLTLYNIWDANEDESDNEAIRSDPLTARLDALVKYFEAENTMEKTE